MPDRRAHGLSVENLVVRYDAGPPAVDGVSFSVSPGELFVLVGPSGCGKSTVLRALAGLVRPERGVVALGGKTVTQSPGGVFVPPSDRHLGLVFQSYALWPQMTVGENVRFPLEARGAPKSAWAAQVVRALERVELAALADRPVPSLSGGQQQRVALARAIVSDPPIVLLDEPLSNLDAELRRQMRTELREIQREVGATMVHVTHDREEAMELGDRVGVMRDGRLLEVGAPEELYRTPAHAWTARFLGETSALVCAEVRSAGPGQALVSTDLGVFRCRAPAVSVPGPSAMVIRAEDIVWSPDSSGDPENLVEGRISTVRFLGSRTLYGIESVGVRLWASSIVHRGEPGDSVSLRLPPESCLLVRRDAD